MNSKSAESRNSAIVKLAFLHPKQRSELLELEAERRGLHMPDAEDDRRKSNKSDLVTADGFPYGTRASAEARATREGGGEVIEVSGGFVVRPKNAASESPKSKPDQENHERP